MIDDSGIEARRQIKVNVQPVCDVLLVASQSHSLRTRRTIMSFFERLKTEASAEWRAYTEHPFTNGLADGSLAEAAFRHYLVQDYLFLTEFARAYALSVYKSPKLADMREAAAGLSAILDIEMNLHVKVCASWGLSPSDLEQTPPAVEMLAYTRYVLDAGMRGDLLALKVALAPCVIGYAEIATRLAAQTVLGGAKMVLETGQHPGTLKDQVTSPGGTTIEGLHELEKGRLRGVVMSAVRAATEKSRKLGQSS